MKTYAFVCDNTAKEIHDYVVSFGYEPLKLKNINSLKVIFINTETKRVSWSGTWHLSKQYEWLSVDDLLDGKLSAYLI